MPATIIKYLQYNMADLDFRDPIKHLLDTYMAELELRDQALEEVIGKTWEQAQQIFQQKYPDFQIRFDWKDGQTFPIHKDIRWTRLTVGIQNNIVMEKYNSHTDPHGSKVCFMAHWG
jgi:hypothetical protein